MFLVETGEGRTPRPEGPLSRIYYRLSWYLVSPPWSSTSEGLHGRQPISLWSSLSASVGPHLDLCRPSAPFEDKSGERSRRFRRLVLAVVRQLLFCHLFTRCDGASACNSATMPPVEPTRPHYSSIIPPWASHPVISDRAEIACSALIMPP